MLIQSSMKIKHVISHIRHFIYFQRIWDKGSAKEVRGPVRVIHRFVNMPEQTAEFYNETTKQFENVSTLQSCI